jgi:hypothetical protein
VRARKPPGAPALAAQGQSPAPPPPPPPATTTSAPPVGGDGGRSEDVPNSTDAAEFDENAPIVYRKTTIRSDSQVYESYTLVQETTTVTEVNSLDQTRTTTTSTSYTEPKEPRAHSATTPTT